jgi:hypothetical protein
MKPTNPPVIPPIPPPDNVDVVGFVGSEEILDVAVGRDPGVTYDQD